MCVDDHPIIRQGLAAVLAADPRMELVAEASSGEIAVAVYREHRPDVTLMDLDMPGITGVEATVRIRREFPAARILVMATQTDDPQILHALAAGASGYLVKGMPMIELLAVIRRAGAQYLGEG
jgi:DNA-binding NarL/FixJ family response regulator